MNKEQAEQLKQLLKSFGFDVIKHETNVLHSYTNSVNTPDKTEGKILIQYQTVVHFNIR